MKTEKTFAILFLIGFALKLFDFPGYSLLLIIALTVMGMLYFPLAFYFFSDKTLKTQNVALSIIGGVALSMLPIGILFKLMFWPGATIQLLGGIIFTFVLFIVTWFLLKKSSSELLVYYKNYLTRIIFWLVIGITFFCITRRQLLQAQHRNHPELIDLKINAWDHPENSSYQEALDTYYRKQDSLFLAGQRPE